MKTQLLASVLMALTLLTGCISPVPLPVPSVNPSPTTAPVAPAATAATFTEAPCPFDLPPGQVEGETVECGYLTVPENRSDPNGRAIRLAVAIFRHPGGAPAPDPILYLEGGPGGSPLEITAQVGFEARFGSMLAANRDLILLDQRGIGFSAPALDCPAFVDLYLDLLDHEVDGEQLDADQRLARKVQTLAACAEELRQTADLSTYNTAESAADVADLRLALGYEQVNLWGASYGSRLALEVMRDYPAGIRSAVLEATYPADVDLYLETPAHFARALDRLFAACAADEACNAAYPDLRTVLFEAVARLNENPVAVELIHPFTGQRTPMRMDGDALLEQIFRALYASEMWPLLPQIIYDAREGTFDALLLVTIQDLWRQDIRSWGMYFSVLCHEEVPFSSPEQFEAALQPYPELAGFFRGFEVGGLSYAVCPLWGAGQADVRENEPVASDVPTLVMAGESDPIAPPAWARRVTGALANGYVFEYPGLGHGVSTSECPRRMMLAFLADPTQAPDDACMDTMETPPFTVPGPAVEIELEPFTSETFSFQGVAPAGWNETKPGIYERGQSPVDVARLIQQAAPGATAAQITAALLPQLGLQALPESTATLDTPAFTWTLYAIQIETPVVGTVMLDLALAETATASYIVLLQASPDDYETLHEALFLPAVEALAPLAEESEE